MKQTRGRLITLDGLDDRQLLTAAKRLLKTVPAAQRGGVSEWDASGLFFQLKLCASPETPSPKTLLLFYASDLAFRWRWEILPQLERGLDVVAAPYVETAVAFGRAAGIPLDWLERLFEFAEKPDMAFRLATPATRAKGFPSHCFSILQGASPLWAKSPRKPMADHLSRLGIPLATNAKIR